MTSFCTFCIVTLLAAAQLSPTETLERREALQRAVESGAHEEVVQLAGALARVQPDDAGLWYQLGRSAFAVQRHELAMEASRKAWDLGYRYMPWIALRIARSAAALDRREEALDWLERALEAGLEDRPRLADYPEFAGYRDDPGFRDLAGLAAPGERTAGIVADIDFLIEEARRLHPAWHQRGPAFEAMAERLKQRAPDLSDTQFLFETMRLVTLLGDGHSWVYGPVEGSPLEAPSKSLPVLFFLFDEGLYIVDGVEEGAALIGRRVDRIGSRTPAELLAHSRAQHGAENDMTMRWLGVHFYFPQTNFLIDAGAIDEADEVKLELATDSGGTEVVVLPTGNHQFPRKLRSPKMDSVTAPRYLERVDDPFWFESIDEHTLYFQFNQVQDAEDESIADFSTKLGAALAKPAVLNLVVDVRHNNGGNNGLLPPLLRQIVAFDVRDETQVFVIIGRNTFSAAQNFVNRLERLTDAIFVGEPSSSSPNFIGEETEVILPWSRILASISSREWQDSDPGDKRSWISPQIPVPPTAEAYFAGRDAALAAIAAVVAASEASHRTAEPATGTPERKD